MASEIRGFRELNRKLNRMAEAPRGKLLRRAVMQGTLPALRAAQSAAPVGTPPYESGDPYPVRTYKGNLRAPGFLKRNIARKSVLSSDKRAVRVMIGPRPEAFYGTQFIELGTTRSAKQPWLEPAFRSSLPAVNARLKARLKALLDKAAAT